MVEQELVTGAAAATASLLDVRSFRATPFRVGLRAIAIALLMLLAVPAGAQAQRGTAKLELSGGVDGARVFVDGRVVARLPLRRALTVQPGTRELQVRAEGYQTLQRRITVSAGERVRVRVRLTPLQPPAPTPAAERGDSTRSAPPSSGGLTPEEIAVQAAQQHLESQQTARDQAPDPPPPPKAPTTGPAPDPAVPPEPPEAEPPQRRERPAPSGRAAPGLSPRAAARTSGAQAPAPPSEPPSESGRRARRSSAGDGDGEPPPQWLILETFVGPSFLFMALGQSDLAAELRSGTLDRSTLESLDPALLEGSLDTSDPTALVDTLSSSGVMTGGAASVRLWFMSVGTRVTYSAYGEADILTWSGELALRFGSETVQGYLGLGLGGGWLYGVPQSLISADSGIAAHIGLGLSFRLHDHIALGFGGQATAVGLGGDGLDPGQLTDLSVDTDHPIGVQLPLHATLSFTL